MSALFQAPTPITDTNPPGKEIGAVTQQVGGANGWGIFVDEMETTPQLQWPSSVMTYHKMRSDSQNEALHLGMVQPVREMRWSVDPNGASAAITEQIASDFGLPIKGHEDDSIGIAPEQGFNFDQFLDDALLAPDYGHFYFEIVGDVVGDEWHMTKMAPRHPKTIAEFQADPTGELIAIRQNISGANGWARLPAPIPAGKLLPFVWRPEAGSHVGRSMLRSLFREWMVKDRTIRVAAMSIERGAGVPVIVGPQGASDKQIADLAQMARQFKIAEGGGGAIPFGSKLELVGGNVPSAVALLEYCDQCMARVWANMIVQLGTTSNGSGSRALGTEFALYAARAQRAMAKWVCGRVNRFFEQYAIWNLGDDISHAPLLSFEQDKPDSMSVSEMVALVEADLLTVDPELESWIRGEYNLPAYTPPTDPELGDLSPDEVALVQNSRNPPPLPGATVGPDGKPLPAPPAPGAPQDVPSVQDHALARRALAAASPLEQVGMSLPARTLRRQPSAIEAASKVDFKQMDATFSATADDLVAGFLQGVVPTQISALGKQIAQTKAGTARKTLTKTAMAGLSAPLAGSDIVDAHLLNAARSGAQAAHEELTAQGVTSTMPSDTQLAAAIGDQSDAVVTMSANSLSLAAQRKAQQMVGGGRTPSEVQSAVTSYLSGMKQDWTSRQLRGAVNFAQNVGRVQTFQSADQTGIGYYASELLDVNTCEECTGVDGTQYDSLADAEADYAGGGYVNCEGGPNCRGTLVAVYNEAASGGDPSGQLVSDFA